VRAQLPHRLWLDLFGPLGSPVDGPPEAYVPPLNATAPGAQAIGLASTKLCDHAGNYGALFRRIRVE